MATNNTAVAARPSWAPSSDQLLHQQQPQQP